MNNILLNNAYGIIGLLPNSTQKEISKRVKEIEKFLEIEEIPNYLYDFNIYNQNRTLSNVKEAYHNISTVEKQILHYFFRVYTNNDAQTELLNNFNNNSDFNIVEYYKNNKRNNFIYSKNIALLLTIQLFKNDSKDALDLCLELWHSILNNDKTYSDFSKIFLLDDEIGISEEHFDCLQEKLILELTKIFSDISKIHNDNEILAKFIKKFNLKSSIYNIDTVENIYNDISNAITMMDELDISADGIFDDNEKTTLKKCLQVFQGSFNKLIDLDLYDTEKTIIIRDLVATKIRIQILDLFNNLEENDTALNLMKFSLSIVGTKGLKAKLSDELNILEEYNKPIDTIKVGKNYTITIYNKYLDINGSQVLYEDVQSVAYLLHTTRTNGIETERTYNFELGVHNHVYYLTQNLGLFSNKQDAENTFYKLINIANYVTPILVEKLYTTILNGRILRIGSLYITKDSYYIRKWNGNKIVRIHSKLAEPAIKEGNVVLYDEQGYSFFQISLNESNAPLLISLIKLLKNKTSNSNCNMNKDFGIDSKYGLHIFYPERETEWEGRWILIIDFLGDLFSWCVILFVIGIVIVFIISLFGG